MSSPSTNPAPSLSDDDRRDPTSLLLLLAPAILLLERFWLAALVPWILPITILVVLAAYHRGSVRLDRRRVSAFLAFGGLALLSAFIHGWLGDVFSARSLAYLLVTYCLFVVVPTVAGDQVRLLRLWQSVSLLCALLGILQFVLFLTTKQVFDVGELLPPSIGTNTGYNTLDFDPTRTLLRSNGMIFLEPSFFSQFMALALVIEATVFRKPYRLGCFLAALLCSMSGTGILMVGAALSVAVVVHPALFLRRGTVAWVGAVALLVVAVATLVPTLRDYFAERIFSSLTLETRNVSSYVRFVAPWVAVGNLFEMGGAETALGLGPGLSQVSKLRVGTQVNLNPITQVAVNYGIVTTAAFVIFVAAVSLRRYTKAQWIVMSTVLFQYLLCSGSLLTPHVSSVLLWFALVFHSSRPDDLAT